MNQKQIIAALKPWAAQYKAIRAAYEPLEDALNLGPENPIFEALYGTFDAYSEVLAQLVGDSGGWLEWYVHENELGDKGMEDGLVDDMRPIRTIADLAWVIRVAA